VIIIDDKILPFYRWLLQYSKALYGQWSWEQRISIFERFIEEELATLVEMVV